MCIEMKVAPQFATLRNDIYDGDGNILIPKSTDVFITTVMLGVYDELMFLVTKERIVTPESEHFEVYAPDVDLWDSQKIADARFNNISPLIVG